jgi:hypothetical protein
MKINAKEVTVEPDEFGPNGGRIEQPCDLTTDFYTPFMGERRSKWMRPAPNVKSYAATFDEPRFFNMPWSFEIEARFDPASAPRFRTHGIGACIESIIASLNRGNGGRKNDVHYAYYLTGDLTDGQGVQMYLGNLSRLRPREVKEAFERCGFTSVRVLVWGGAKDYEAGFVFESPDSTDFGWEFHLPQTRESEKLMLLHRKRLLKHINNQTGLWIEEDPSCPATIQGSHGREDWSAHL